MRPLRAFLVCLAVGAAVGFWLAGPVLYRAFIGLDPSAFPAGMLLDRIGRTLLPSLGFSLAGAVLVIGILLAVGAASFVLVRRASRAQLDPARRSFLAGAASGAGAAVAATAAGGAAVMARAFLGVGNEGRGWRPEANEIFGAKVENTSPTWPDAWKGARVRAYRRLGRTGVEVSDISLGTGALQGAKGEAIVREAIARGVTYIDTAPDYSGAGSENAIGRAIRGQRDRLFIATKFCTPQGHLPPGTPVARYKEVLEGSLQRLGTDHVDLAHVHSCDEIDRLMDPNLHEAFDRLKAEGKVRFLGFSSHTPNLVQVASRAIESNRFDVMMLAYHHGIWPSLGEVIARARRERDMGVVAMKTLKGARHNGLAGFRDAAGGVYSQAAFRWVLSNPEVSCLVVSFYEPQHVDEYLFASGSELNAQDHAVLRRYDDAIAGSYCPPHCGACLDHCSQGLAIHDVFRFRMYFEDYGWEKRGMAQYAALARNASACVGCSAPCLGHCPAGIAIQDRMIESHDLLRLA